MNLTTFCEWANWTHLNRWSKTNREDHSVFFVKTHTSSPYSLQMYQALLELIFIHLQIMNIHFHMYAKRGTIKSPPLNMTSLSAILRSSDVATRKKYVNLVDSIKASGGTVHIFSSMHVSGERKYSHFNFLANSCVLCGIV